MCNRPHCACSRATGLKTSALPEVVEARLKLQEASGAHETIRIVSPERGARSIDRNPPASPEKPCAAGREGV